MERGYYFILVFILLISLTNAEITGEVITGEATQTVDANITVTSYYPSLTISSPENITYSSNISILLNYSVANYETTWYNLDGLDNIIITSPLTFNTSEGSHTLYLYANNSIGNITTRNVTFDVNESAVEEPAPLGIGAGVVIKDFTVETELIEVSLKQGETKTEEIRIKNIGDEDLFFTISSSGIEEFIKIRESSFTIKEGKSKTIKLEFLTTEDTAPNLYQGKVIVKASNIEKEITILIEVESKDSQLDLTLDIPSKFRYVRPGEEVRANLEIVNLGELRPVEAKIEYFLKNNEGETILLSDETIKVDTKLTLNKIIRITNDFKLGEYVLYVRVIYNEKVSSDIERFYVVDDFVFLSPRERFKEIIYTYWYLFFIFPLIIILVIIIILCIRGKRCQGQQ